MNKKRIFALVAAMIVACAMLACKETAPASNSQALTGEGTVNGFEYGISEYEPAKYQISMLEEKGFYVDQLEESDSPAFVFISAGKKHGNGVSMNVKSIEADDEGNITITVFESGKESILGAKNYPTVQVEIYPMPKSISVFDEDGTALSEH